MKSSELYRKLIKDGWYIHREGKGSYKLLRHPTKTGEVLFADHGSNEVAKGTANKILKDAGLK
ncbi:MAG: type II toxin-antitoxin system HicA family toxin [Fulvivirga sp.]